MYWLTAKNILPGLFPSECTVHLATADGDVQVFVSRQQIDAARGTVLVTLLDQDDRFALVHVASQGGGNVAKIEKAGVLSPT